VPEEFNFNGFTVETWVAFLSEDGLMAPNSIYTGELMVQQLFSSPSVLPKERLPGSPPLALQGHYSKKEALFNCHGYRFPG
jgi:hypothetical protein